jgi:hypothetical protein
MKKTKRARLLEEIRHIQSSNANLAYSAHDWIMEDIEHLMDYNNKILETWIYGAKIIVKVNNTKRKQEIQNNRARQQHSITSVRKPVDKSI